MRYLIQVKSEEEKSFGILLQIDAEATFLELHDFLIEVCQYDPTQMASFFTIAENGQRLQEISLMELSSEDAELNEAVMDVSTLGEFIGEKIKTVEYQYDFFGDRYFTLKVVEIQKGSQDAIALVNKNGTPPPQISLDGFEGLDLAAENQNSDEKDYESYLSSFDDCKGDDIDFQSLDDLDDDDLY
ncbi:pRiA4b ORF-3-like protein [Balneicella halophila]|uniref:PRiA4b ORF-3-like protein n=1 Tax=Balneicella halophila TaxID=1537566 RepID=A0A7L4UPV6_BALHA|nr:hypothetical protein [Balneicella halophila]PVX51808.1 pRiA4b ORF-3-like protein [Balneicella halophila]